MWRLAWTIAAVAAFLLLALGGAVLYGLERFERPGPLPEDRVVYIAPGSGLSAIVAELEAAGVIAEPLIFRLGTRALGDSRRLQAGEYLFPAGISMREAVALLVSGKTIVHRLTLPEGILSAEAAILIAEAEPLVGELAAVPPEGSLLPETYHFARGDRRSDLVARMQAARDEALAELWPARSGDLPFSTQEDAVILASIVEKETAVAEERPLVASVFVNRLRKGMRLQSDPTVVYGLTDGKGPLGRDLTRADLQAPTPYNTYLIDGLPPGPIANPGLASLAAVLDPAESEYLYFVADGSGGHAFAKTLAEHNRNVAKWRKIRSEHTAD